MGHVSTCRAFAPVLENQMEINESEWKLLSLSPDIYIYTYVCAGLPSGWRGQTQTDTST